MRHRDERPGELSGDSESTPTQRPWERDPEQEAEQEAEDNTDGGQRAEPSPDFPQVPGRDVGLGGTRDVDTPPNTREHTPEVPEPPD